MNRQSFTTEEAIQRGLEAQRAGNYQEAVQAFRSALLHRPDHVDALQLLGSALLQTGDHSAAEEALSRAIEAAPDFPSFHYNRAIALQALGRREEAVEGLRRALGLKPDYPNALLLLGRLLLSLDRAAEARERLERLVALQPGSAEAHLELGISCIAQDDVEAAAERFQAAARSAPNSASAWGNLAGACKELGRLDEAIAHYRRALQIVPNNAYARRNLALALIMAGDYAGGFREYEHRWAVDAALRSPYRYRPEQQWRGEPLAGKTLLIWPEQGYGDNIQFVRYAPLLRRHSGARAVIVQCAPELARLFASLGEDIQVVPLDQAPPEFDLHCPVLSLPALFGTTPQTVPASVPYLAARREDAARFEPGVPRDERLNVGVVWATGGWERERRMRSLPPRQLFPVFDGRDDLRLVSLQVGAPSDYSRPPDLAPQLHDCTGQLRDFADTAALIGRLDLVVTADTAVAHLAGALGKPVWVLLAYAISNFYVLGRQNTPWYPTMRIYRQHRRNDWSGALCDLRDDLVEWKKESASPARTGAG